MNNIWLILKREYFEHVKKRSFIISTILMPLIIPAIIVLIGFLVESFRPEEKTVIVIDESGLFSQLKVPDQPLEFTGQTLEQAKLMLEDESVHGILYIPQIRLNYPRGMAYYSKSSPGLFFTSKLTAPLRERLRELKMQQLELDQSLIEQLNIPVNISTFIVSKDGSSKQTSSEISILVGYIMGFMIYMFMLIYGTFIMQAVLTEKTSKVVEVIIASAKPFQLMLGKILGVGSVAITQIAIWTIMFTCTTFIVASMFDYSANSSNMVDTASAVAEETPAFIVNILDIVYSLPYGQLFLIFIIYFIGGFLLYGSLFAAVGSAVESMQEAQQFSIVLTVPIIISLIPLMIVAEHPHSALAVGFSWFPLTSPVAMLARIPFDVPMWEILISIGLLNLAILVGVWISSRIYRIGILTTGSKVNYRVLWKWLFA